MNKNFKNFAVLSLVLGELRTGKTKDDGKPYLVAGALLPMGEEKPAMPVKIVLLGELAGNRSVKTGQTLTFLGRLLYEEKEAGKGTLVLRPYQVQETSENARNFVKLTLRVGTEPDPRYSAGGTFWARLRAAFGQGKDENGQWLPSAWFTVKGFTHDGDESVPQALSLLKKGELVTISGRLGYDVSPAGQKRYLSLYATKVEPFSPEDEESLPGEEPEPDPVLDEAVPTA